MSAWAVYRRVGLICFTVLSPGGAGLADGLGGQRLFTDARQRAQIDAALSKAGPAPNRDLPAVPRRPLHLQGLLAVSGRPARIWLNGRQLLAGQVMADARLLPGTDSSPRGSVLLYRSGQRFRLRPGQRHDDSGVRGIRLESRQSLAR